MFWLTVLEGEKSSVKVPAFGKGVFAASPHGRIYHMEERQKEPDRERARGNI
jgi:hypothetical protein